MPAADMSPSDSLKSNFLLGASQLRYINEQWNPQGHDFSREYSINFSVMTALRLSQIPTESADPFFPGMTWGNGKWPSIQFAQHFQLSIRIYGIGFPTHFSTMSLHGMAFRHAAERWGNERYTTANLASNESDVIGKYHTAVAENTALLPFTLYVPPGYGKVGDKTIPNVEETTDPSLTFTASFNSGQEVWQKLSLSSIP